MFNKKLASVALISFALLVPFALQADSATVSPPGVGSMSAGSEAKLGGRASRSANTNYVAATDGFVTASCYGEGAVFIGLEILINGGIVARTRGASEGHLGYYSATSPVLKGETYRVRNMGNCGSWIIRWVPLGN